MLPVVVLTVQPHYAAIPARKIVRHFGESQGYQGEIKDQEKLRFPVSVVQKSSWKNVKMRLLLGTSA